MSSFNKLFVLLLVAVFGLASAATADDRKDDKRKRTASSAAFSAKTGTCSLGNAFSDLDVNNVRARLFNTGALFWKGAGNIYQVPKTGNASAIFASGIWIGGLVNGELRMVASDYGPYELWPGPLDDQGMAPADCSQFDRMYNVRRQDIQDFNDTGVATPDLADWPWELGAPVVDGDGNPNNYNLAGGDRPEILGDQGIWWVMNDMGGEHAWSGTAPIGLEVQVLAFSFQRADALNNTTFYRYTLINKGGNTLTETYFGIWSDPDLGDAADDYVGSDTTRGIGFVWNGDNDDGGAGGYGSQPPATGYDFFQGPLVNNDGIDNDNDGDVDEDDERIAMTKFVYYNNDSTVQGNPDGGPDAYRYLRGLWRDDVPITFGGTGRGFSEEPADFMFPGEPGEFWSESNTDGNGAANTPADRRFLMSSGPFTLDAGAVQEIVYGIVWSQGADNVASVAQMKNDDALAQAAFDVGFVLPPAPDAPRVEASELDGVAVLTWGYRPSDNNYLNSYDVANPFLADVEGIDDKTYTFEGYTVYQYSSPEDQVGRVIANYDVVNGVTKVVDITDATVGEIPLTTLSANGSDNGAQNSIRLDNLTNYTDAYFGVQAYGFNDASAPKILRSAITRVTIRPSRSDARNGGSVVNLDNFGVDFTGEKVEGSGGGFVEARVVDPAAVTGAAYRVEFFTSEVDGEAVGTNYSVVNSSTGEVVFDGNEALASTGKVAPQGANIFIADGIEFTVSGPEPSFLDLDGAGTAAFVQVAAPNGFDPCGADAISTFGCAQVGGNFMYPSFDGTGELIMYHQGAGAEAVIGNYAPNDYEIRFTETGSIANHPFTSGRGHRVPYETWDIGPVGPFGENDPSDDVQMIPSMFADNQNDLAEDDVECNFGYTSITEDPFGLGWPGTQRVYAYYAVNDYATWESIAGPEVDAAGGCAVLSDAAFDEVNFGRGRPIQRIVWYGDPAFPGFDAQMGPMAGHVFRFLTTKPNLPGDIFSLDTSGFEAVTGDAATARAALDLIGISPNPYKGASAYETTNLNDVARFINMPEQATIRVFTLAGTLIKTLIKNGPEASLDWDLTTDSNLPVASGMYLIHIDAPGLGEKVLKFAVIKKRIQLDLI
ncbi:MAG: T9SS type A sorting domain-containing protein [Bacteroidota bacterium]